VSVSSRERTTRCRSPTPGRRQHLADFHLEETMIPATSLPPKANILRGGSSLPRRGRGQGYKELGFGFMNRRSLPEGSHILPSHVTPRIRGPSRRSPLESVDTPEKATSSGVKTRRITHNQQPRSDEGGGSLHISTPTEAPTRPRKQQTPEEAVVTPGHSRRTDASHQ